MKKLLVMFLAIYLCVCPSFLVSAETLTAQNNFNQKYVDEIQTAETFIKTVLEQEADYDIIELYSIDDNVAYLFFDLDEKGYVIVDISTNTVVEGAKSENNIYEGVSERKYYNGPFNYYKKSTEGFTNISTKEEYMRKQLVLLQPNNSVEQIVADSIAPRAESDYSVRITGTVPVYSTQGTYPCASVAAAMFVRYYDIYKNNNFVATNLETSNGIALIEVMMLFINYNSNGATAEETADGLNNYLDARGVSKNVVETAYSATVFKSQIAANNPVIVGLQAGAISDEPHMVTAYGYYVAKAPSIKYLIINNGYGNSGVYVAPGYAIDIIY